MGKAGGRGADYGKMQTTVRVIDSPPPVSSAHVLPKQARSVSSGLVCTQ